LADNSAQRLTQNDLPNSVLLNSISFTRVWLSGSDSLLHLLYRNSPILPFNKLKRWTGNLQALFHDLLRPSISQHGEWSVITAHNLTPVKRDRDETYRYKFDKSMNRDEGSYQFLHIYDRLCIAATSSGEEKSFRKRQQRLPKRQQSRSPTYRSVEHWAHCDLHSRVCPVRGAQNAGVGRTALVPY